MEIDPIQQLISLDMSEQQARAYWALLSCQPATAYEISRAAQIPTTSIYNLIHELLERGIIIPSDDSDEKSRRYLALEPEIFLDRVRQRVSKQTQNLSPILYAQIPSAQAEFVWPINSRNLMLQTADNILSRARRVILVSIHPHELNELRPLLTNRLRRRVKTAMLYHGENCQFKSSCVYSTGKIRNGDNQDRSFHMVADGSLAMAVSLTPLGAVTGCWSKHLAMVNLVEDHIRQQIQMAKLMQHMAPAIQKIFGKNLDKLNDIFHE